MKYSSKIFAAEEVFYCNIFDFSYGGKKGRHDTQHNDILHDDTQHNGINCKTRPKGKSGLDTKRLKTLSIMI